MSTAYRAILLASCVGLLVSCGEDDTQQVYEPTPAAPDLEQSGDYGVLPSQDDRQPAQAQAPALGQQAGQRDLLDGPEAGRQQQPSAMGNRQQDAGTSEDRTQESPGQAIPPGSAVEFRD